MYCRHCWIYEEDRTTPGGSFHKCNSLRLSEHPRLYSVGGTSLFADCTEIVTERGLMYVAVAGSYTAIILPENEEEIKNNDCKPIPKSWCITLDVGQAIKQGFIVGPVPIGVRDQAGFLTVLKYIGGRLWDEKGDEIKIL